MPGMSTAEAVVERLIQHGIDTVYGLPGVHNDPLFDAFYGARNRLRVLHTRHEQSAAYMALGAALATGRPQAFAVVPGPGFLNAAAALLTAYGVGAPVLGLLGQIPQRDIDRGHGHLHELRDQLGIARHFTGFAARIEAPHEAPGLVSAALAATTTGRPGPAVLECAMDVWPRRAAIRFDDLPAPAAPPPIDAAAADRAASLLAGAARPLIVVGGGALAAAAEVRALAERLEAPVLSYRRGRGVLPTTHRLAVSLPVGHRLWRDADVVLAIGTRLHAPQAQWGVDAGLKIIRIDIDGAAAGRLHRPAVALTGDAAACAAALLARLPEAPRPSRAAELEAHAAWFATRLARLEPQMAFLRAMRAALPAEGIFVDEVTQLGFASRLAFPVPGPRKFLSPGYQDNLGWGYGAALGAQAACPDVPVLAIAGDGGFMYQASELATARQHGLPVVVVVFDNGLYGNVRLIQREQYGDRRIASDLHNPDFVRFAESFGVAACRAETPAALERAAGDALAARQPALIHVPCGEMPSPWDMLMLPRVRG